MGMWYNAYIVIYIHTYTPTALGIDPDFGCSTLAFVLTVSMRRRSKK